MQSSIYSIILLFLTRFLFYAACANLPTLTISNSKFATNTIRFPSEVSSTFRTTNLLVTEPFATTISSTTASIQPSKSEHVHIVGNYSIAVQQVILLIILMGRHCHTLVKCEFHEVTFLL